MSLMDSIKQKAKSEKKRILLPEGTEERTVQAVAQIQSQGIAEATLLGKTDEILAVAKKFNVSLDGVSLVDPEKDADYASYVEAFYELRKEKGVTTEKAAEMMATAQKNAQELAMDAGNYADQVFNLVEANLSQSLETVRKGHDELKQQFRK